MSIFETLREQVTIEDIVGRGAEIRGGKARCVAPDHEDADPSMHLYGDRVHCFSCGFHGDGVDVWAAMQDFDRPLEAAHDLAQKYGVELPDVSPEARQKAVERRKKEDQRFLDAYCPPGVRANDGQRSLRALVPSHLNTQPIPLQD